MAKEVTFSHRVQGEGHPVDLTRDEFIHFQELMSRISGGMRTRTLSLVFSLILAAAVIGGEVMLWKNGEAYDLILIAMGLFLAGLALLLWCYVPFQVRRRAGRLYDRTVKSGISHYGLLRVALHGIMKEKATLTATVPLNNGTFYIEDTVMQVVFNRMGQAIVLPARCMTPVLAEDVRRAAQQLPPTNYRFFSRLEPLGQVAIPPADVTGQVILDETVQYTPEEYVDVTKALTVQRFWQKSPLYCSVALMLALFFSVNAQSAWVGAVTFLLAVGGLALLCLVFPLRRIPNMVDRMSAEALSLQMTLDDRGLRVQKSGQGEVGLPWSDVTHVYDGDTMVEITAKNLFFRIPKRLIADFEEFSKDIEQYFHK